MKILGESYTIVARSLHETQGNYILLFFSSAVKFSVSDIFTDGPTLWSIHKV